jgi:hypothetical protein
MKSFKLLLAMIFALTILIPVLSSRAAASPPQVLEDTPITGSATHKWPSVAVGNGVVNIAWSNTEEANFAQRLEESGQFGSAKVGSVGNNSSYFNAAVAVGQDGVVHYAWINNGSTIYHISRSGATWSGVHVVAAGQNFANTLNIAVRGTSQVFIAWRHQGASNGAIGFAYSDNGGSRWPIITNAPTPEGVYAGRPDLVAGAANLPVYLTWTGTDGSVYLGEWNNSNFNTACLSCPRYGARNDFFNPSISMSNDGRPYVVWRSVGGGVFYASRQPTGTWGYSRAFAYPEVSSVGIAVDKRNNVHIAWLSKANNRIDGFYSVGVPQTGGGESFTTPIMFSGDNGAFKANLDIAASLKTSYGLAHIAYESFGGGQFIRYARVRTDGIGCAVGVADTSGSEEVVRPRAIFMNPIYLPMTAKPAAAPTPTPSC